MSTLLNLLAVLVPFVVLPLTVGLIVKGRRARDRRYGIEPIRKPPPLPPGPRRTSSSGSARPLIGLGLFIGSGIAWNSGDYGLSGTLFSMFVGFMIVSLLSR